MLALAGSTLAVFALAGCSAPVSTSPSAPAPDAPVASLDAATADSSLGEIIVDGEGMTAYFFNKDVANSGTSACVADCVAVWPAITTTSDTPTVTGITGTVGTITGAEGGKQITINGLPIYTFANDLAPGDVNGQGVKEVWYVVSPSGEKITTAP